MKKSNRGLENLHLNREEALDWYGPVSDLIQKLNLIKKLLRAIR